MLLWIYCFRLFFIRTFVCLSISWSTAWNLGSFKVYSLFSYQCTSSILRIDFRSCFATSEWIFQPHSLLLSLGDSLFTISYRQPFVNNFFYFISFIIWWASGEGGIWTLAPLLTTCTLSRGVPSASLGTSPYSCSNHFLSREVMILTQKKNSFEFFFKRLNRLAERMGFEPMCPCGQTVFKTASLWPLRYLSICFLSNKTLGYSVSYLSCCL